MLQSNLFLRWLRTLSRLLLALLLLRQLVTHAPLNFIRWKCLNLPRVCTEVGNYSIVAQRHLVLKDWTAATANVEYELNLNAPTGNIQEFTICAVPTPGANAHRDVYANAVLPTEVRVVVDGITVYEKKARQIAIENYNPHLSRRHVPD